MSGPRRIPDACAAGCGRRRGSFGFGFPGPASRIPAKRRGWLFPCDDPACVANVKRRLAAALVAEHFDLPADLRPYAPGADAVPAPSPSPRRPAPAAQPSLL